MLIKQSERWGSPSQGLSYNNLKENVRSLDMALCHEYEAPTMWQGHHPLMESFFSQ